jgi:hypothetical protein
MEDRYTAHASRANTMPKYIGLRVNEYTPVQTKAADVSGFNGLTVVLARRKDITPPIATATPTAPRTAATSSRTDELGQLQDRRKVRDRPHAGGDYETHYGWGNPEL